MSLVDPPPDVLQTECPVCLLIIREPHQVTCCGNSFCHSCIEYIKASNKPCPTCNEEYSIFPDKRLKRTISAFEVRCTHQKDGCEWTGELGQLDAHLNKNPMPGKELDGCQFVEIDCPYECGDQLQRQYIQSHLTENCPTRPFSCEHCHNYDSNYDYVIHNHWPVCGSFPLHCPNECGLELPRQDIDSHVDNECPLTTINCDFHHVGCTVKLPRKDIPEHLKENLHTHVSLLATSHAKQQAEIACYKIKNLQLEQTILELKRALKEEVASSKLSDSITIPLTPPVLIMSNFKRHKRNKDIWLSPSVYTHHRGYKICLRVDANGHGTDSHVSAFLHFMKGEFDDYLKWPFRGSIWMQVLDRHDGSRNVGHVFKFDDKIRKSACSRVTVGEISAIGCGKPNLIAHSELEPKYLLHDTLLFQIDKVELDHTV